MRISISTGPDASDPQDRAPILLFNAAGEPSRFAARTWRARIAIRLLRSYVATLFYSYSSHKEKP